MIKLERCPFCGSLAGYSRVPGQGFSVVCRGCGAIAMHELTQERDDVARAWNLRAPQAAPGGGVRPCPFCGSAVVVAGSFLRCPHCGMMISFAQSGSQAESLELWNRRVFP